MNHLLLCLVEFTLTPPPLRSYLHSQGLMAQSTHHQVRPQFNGPPKAEPSSSSARTSLKRTFITTPRERRRARKELLVRSSWRWSSCWSKSTPHITRKRQWWICHWINHIFQPCCNGCTLVRWKRKAFSGMLLHEIFTLYSGFFSSLALPSPFPPPFPLFFSNHSSSFSSLMMAPIHVASINRV